MSSRSLTLSFPARAEYLLLPRLVLSGVARSCEMSEETLADLRLAITEACGNAVRHAYDDGMGIVKVELSFDNSRIRVVVEDDGEGLELSAVESVPGPSDGLVANESEGGMGLAIIRAIADEVDITPAGNRGTRVTFTKAFAS